MQNSIRENQNTSAGDFNESSDLANLCLRLRGGLNFEMQEYGNQPYFVIHDETTSSYYQIGVPEYALLSVLDGKTTLQQAVEQTSFRLGDKALTIRDAIRTTHWLMESGLADVVDSDGISQQNNVEHLLEQQSSRKTQKIVGQLNPLFIKFPVGDPQPFLTAVSPVLKWIGSKAFFYAWVLILLLAVFRIMQQPGELAIAAHAIFAPHAWIWMLVTMVGLKIAHELGHGLFCNCYGGRVKETGFVFILFIPIPYVDVTSSWGFASKWQRIAVASAGMYVEIFLAALAAIAWSFVQDPVLRFHLFNVMLIGSLTTILFNANFLMRFDGYYILADWLEIPNLYQKGQQFVNGLGQRFLLGMNAGQDREQRGRQTLVATYGIGAWIWRIVICVSLSILAAALFYGFGIALAIAGAAAWIGVPISRSLKNWCDPTNNNRPNLKWISTITIPVAAGLLAAMLFLPWPVQVSAPAIVEYETPSVIRAHTASFVKHVHVASGQTVVAGDLLIELENRELESRLHQLKLDREQSFIRSRGFHQNREVAAYQSENASRSSTDDQILQLEEKLASLTLVAPADGIVVGQDLQTLPGQFVNEGSDILQVVNESKKEIVAAISQDDFETFSNSSLDNDADSTSGNAIFAPSFRTQSESRLLRHGTVYRGKLNRVNPTASSTADIRLTSYAGGRLAVRPASSTSGQPNENDNQSMELIAPRFTAKVKLNAEQASSLLAGTTGQVRLEQFNETIAQHVVKRTRSWLNNCFQAAGLQ